MDKRIQYLPLDEEDQIYSEKESIFQRTERRIMLRSPEEEEESRMSGGMIWLCHGILLSISTTLFVMALCMRYGVTYDLYSTRQFFPYSPAASVVQYQTTRQAISPNLEHSTYVGYGPDVDEAWNHISRDVGDQMISREELDRLGLDPLSVKIRDPETGEHGYRAGLQVFHQLQCLNLLRQDSFRDYYSHQSRDFKAPRHELRRHLDHCIEVLRTSLMCQSDVSVFTYKHYEGIPGRWPDLNSAHTCRNFDAIRDWAFENAVASKRDV